VKNDLAFSRCQRVCAATQKQDFEYRHGERTKAAIAEQRKFSALLKMLRAGLT
jgi:hypothetical protein